MKNLVLITITGLLILWFVTLLRGNSNYDYHSSAAQEGLHTFHHPTGIYGASMNLHDARGNLTTVSVDSIKKSYRKVGPFSLKVAPFIEAKNVVIQTSGSVNEPKTLLLNSFGNVLGKDFVTHVTISELVIITGGQTNRYDKVRL